MIPINLQIFPKIIGNVYHKYVEVSFGSFLFLELGRMVTLVVSSLAFLPFPFLFSFIFMLYVISLAKTPVTYNIAVNRVRFF